MIRPRWIPECDLVLAAGLRLSGSCQHRSLPAEEHGVITKVYRLIGICDLFGETTRIAVKRVLPVVDGSIA
jgi:hypothetical protein